MTKKRKKKENKKQSNLSNGQTYLCGFACCSYGQRVCIQTICSFPHLLFANFKFMFQLNCILCTFRFYFFLSPFHFNAKRYKKKRQSERHIVNLCHFLPKYNLLSHESTKKENRRKTVLKQSPLKSISLLYFCRCIRSNTAVDSFVMHICLYI